LRKKTDNKMLTKYSSDRKFNVCYYGAIGNGKTLNTRSIQQAIDTCHKDGGGVVYFPPGIYITGTLFLKSNVTLHLETGSILRGSIKKKDYYANPVSNYRKRTYRCLIYANNIENIGICGRGIIDGMGQKFWTRKRINHPVAWAPKKYRPRVLMYFENCRNILLRDITIHNSPSWTVWMLGCDIGNIHGITILNHRKGPNTDGLDIDCCSNIHISDCHIDAGDDCIAIKSDAGGLKRNKPCENITVTNCTLSSTACAIRVGYEGDSVIKNCVFSNLVIFDSHIGIDLISILPVKRPGSHIEKGCPIENVRFSNIVMEGVQRAIFVWMGIERRGDFKGRIKNIAFTDIIAKTTNSSYISGAENKWIDCVELRNVNLIMQGEMKCEPNDEQGIWGFDRMPYGLYCQRIYGLKLIDVHVEMEKVKGDWLNPIRCRKIDGLEIRGFNGKAIKGKQTVAAIQIEDVRHAFISSCRSIAGMYTFLNITGKESEKISVIGNDLSGVKKAFEFGKSFDKKNLFEAVNKLD